jgi:4-hydroxybenzoate polyprenyltransferase
MLGKLAHFLRMIKFSHTIFALPFALSALLIITIRYRTQVEMTPLKVVLIVAAFTGMRSFAMAFNRIADHKIDRRNARTAMREIPAGKLSINAVWAFSFLALVVLVVSAWLLSPVAGYLALPAALLVASYSLAKRFTWLCHFWLGTVIGLAPIAVYIALLQEIRNEAWLMSGVLGFYIAGFDILYALQDRDFDLGEGLHSVPVRFGISGSMWISRGSHTAALVLLAILLYQLHLHYVSWLTFIVLVSVLITEHYLVGSPKKPRYEKIPIAFFHMNTAFSIIFLLTVVLGLLPEL